MGCIKKDIHIEDSLSISRLHIWESFQLQCVIRDVILIVNRYAMSVCSIKWVIAWSNFMECLDKGFSSLVVSCNTSSPHFDWYFNARGVCCPGVSCTSDADDTIQ